MNSVKLKNKDRFILTIFGGFISFILIYQIAIKQTWEVHSKAQLVEQQLMNNEQWNGSIDSNVNKLKSYEKLIGSNFNDNKEIKDLRLLLDSLSLNYKVKVIGFKEFRDIVQDGYRIKLSEILLSGRYLELTKVANTLEGMPSLGKVKSIRFILQKREQGELELNMYLYVQNINKN